MKYGLQAFFFSVFVVVLLSLFWSVGTYVLSKLSGSTEDIRFYFKIFALVFIMGMSLILAYLILFAIGEIFNLN